MFLTGCVSAAPVPWQKLLPQSSVAAMESFLLTVSNQWKTTKNPHINIRPI